jgi:pilus assembly protein CpaB
MHLDRRFVVVIAVSLVWALLVTGIFYRLAATARRSGFIGPEKPLIVASRPLPMGTVVDKDSVKTIRVPERLFPKGAFSRTEEVLDRGVISAMEPDEPLLDARMAAKGSGVGLAGMIPPGMRAISVRVNDVVGVAGFVLPGMRVDVLVTGRPPGRDDTVTATVLQNIAVISAGQTVQVDAKSQPINTPVVTLLVNPAQAEALTLALTEGKIQLILRNSTDHQVAQTAGRQTRELYAVERSLSQSEIAPRAVSGQKRPVAEPARAPASVASVAVSPPRPSPEEVMVIRGNVKTMEQSALRTAGLK